MLTASHNPPIFNGFKLKSHYGGSSDSETCKAVEGWLDKIPVRRETRRCNQGETGRGQRYGPALPR